MALETSCGPVPPCLWIFGDYWVPSHAGTPALRVAATSPNNEDCGRECRREPLGNEGFRSVPAGRATGVRSPLGWELHGMETNLHAATGDLRSLVDSDSVGARSTRL